ncbi:hypothetical protein PCL_12842 [Purpureocillium lilacinum]|uniref:Uncharacterized protein n=1 Tax=Purpureocillium lilacinum TaxID=33203 RepID=A0A2U3E7G2_PURLI|nr:hypothetical protein PCL_12842 [Purpureocillium lilacinum]
MLCARARATVLLATAGQENSFSELPWTGQERYLAIVCRSDLSIRPERQEDSEERAMVREEEEEEGRKGKKNTLEAEPWRGSLSAVQRADKPCMEPWNLGSHPAAPPDTHRWSQASDNLPRSSGLPGPVACTVFFELCPAGSEHIGTVDSGIDSSTWLLDLVPQPCSIGRWQRCAFWANRFDLPLPRVPVALTTADLATDNDRRPLKSSTAHTLDGQPA